MVFVSESIFSQTKNILVQLLPVTNSSDGSAAGHQTGHEIKAQPVTGAPGGPSSHLLSASALTSLWIFKSQEGDRNQ